MKLSILLCTCNRSRLLDNALNALLMKSNALPDQVVIVNGGNDNTPEVVDRYKKAFKPIKLINTKNINLSVSQNIGLRYCTGDIIATTDDDGIVSENWVSLMKKVHSEHSEAGGVGGSIINGYEDSIIARAANLISFEPPFKRAGYVRTIAGVNISYKKKIMERVGKFDETLPAGMDVDYNWRVIQAGYKIYYDPAIQVTHMNRSTLASFCRQQFWHGTGYYINRRKWKDLPSVLPSNFTGLKKYLKGIKFILDFFWMPLVNGLRAKKLTDKIVFIPIFILREISWRGGIIYQKMISR